MLNSSVAEAFSIPKILLQRYYPAKFDGFWSNGRTVGRGG